MGKIKEAYAARDYLRETNLRVWHPLGQFTAIFTVIPWSVAFSSSLSYLNIYAALLIGIPFVVASEFMLGFWALRKTREGTELTNDKAPA